ncbi:electron transporter RnfC [candidate division TA06 bacterium DG_26]|uniref:Ion-translocating oxidoreductase complex subunit C n=1 Tax=candidate division TA06 bacterium DG_26 TaxID=1703771 RepID=A0A0S7WHH8_UNCT6|nr:MAG: electron transporter RnfC [candidate division TA06 bacterium DG_26]
MGLKSFRGGIHPETFKQLTRDKPIREIPPPTSVIIPLSQHTGAPSEPVVDAGTHVKVGQKIAEAKGLVSVPQHASISGTVKELRDYPHPVLGKRMPSFVIEADGSDEWIPLERKDASDMSGKEIIAAIKDAGIVGLGGAAFPTHVKLSPPPNKPIDTLIVNGAECEPYITCDHRLMLERTEEILDGLGLLRKLLQPERIIVGIEANKRDAIEKFVRARNGSHVEVVALKVKYPQGDEKQMIETLLGRQVPSGGLPMDVGVLVQNVGTVFSVWEAVIQKKPLVERVLTVTGSAVKDPSNLKVRIGTLVRDVIAQCGGYDDSIGRLIMGGPLMGISQYTDEIPVLKGTSAILVQTQEEVFTQPSESCIRCARCVDVCPVSLLPAELAKLADRGKFEECEQLGALDCRECGCCSYVCPAKINIVHLIKYAKMEILSKKS